MARIALDATYVVDPYPSGVSTYSRRLIETLATLESPHRFLICYRLSRFSQRRRFLRFPAARGKARFVTTYFQQGLTPWLPFRADLFHSLAQRPPAFRFRREVVTINDVFAITSKDYSSPSFQKKFARLLLESACRASLIITPSRYTANELMRVAEIPQERIRIIPDGVDLPLRLLSGPERSKERARIAGEGNRLILLVGAVQTRKNTLGAVRALEAMPQRYRMILAGSDGHGADETYDYIRRSGLSERVIRAGYVSPEKLEMLYQIADVLLFPSFEEGFGFPVLEAMASGLPVVVARTSSIPELCGDAALCVNPYDEREMRDQVVRAAEDEALRRELIARGFARAKEFTWRRTAEATLKVYEEALQN